MSWDPCAPEVVPVPTPSPAAQALLEGRQHRARCTQMCHAEGETPNLRKGFETRSCSACAYSGVSSVCHWWVSATAWETDL